MAFSPPTFNLLADVWFCGNTPALGDPDFENQACQLYLPSRVVVAIDRSEHNYFVSCIQVRVPLEAVVNWASAFIYEIPAESGRYYVALFKERQHQGFPNEYLLTGCLQCDNEGNPIMRDVCPSLTPSEHSINGASFIGGDITSEGSVIKNPSGGFHNVNGSSEITGDVSGAGEVSQERVPHSINGTGEINAAVDGQGTVNRT